jgi:hypothetical protein
VASVFRIEGKSKQETSVKAGGRRAVTSSDITYLYVYHFLPPNFLHGLFFGPEDGGSTFLRNFIERLLDYTASEENVLHS